VVFAGAHWLGFVPAYARYPYQVHLTARRHTPTIVGIASAEQPDGIQEVESQDESAAMVELARALLRVVRAYNRVYEAPMPYMLAIHQLADERFHLHIELLPAGRAPGKLKLAASSEAAWGFWVNDSLPDVKAAELRAAMREIVEEAAPGMELGMELGMEPGAKPGAKPGGELRAGESAR
jgi:UDPglucose--hexose-1-phosphate uridylyltransferase